MKDIGTLLVQKNLITQGQLRELHDVQMQKGGELGRICLDMGFLDERRLATALAQLMGLPKVDLARVTPDMDAIAKLPRSLAANVWAFPYALKDRGKTLWVAMANPLDENGKIAVQRASDCVLKLSVAGYQEIEAAIEAHYNPEDEEADQLALDSFDDDVPVKITDMAGNTLITMAPKAAPPSAPAPPVRAPVAARAAEPAAPAAELPPLTPEETRMVEMLREGIGKSASALHVVLDLCVERGLFTREEIAGRLKR